MQTRSKKSAARPTKELAHQLERFKEIARDVGADESPGALDRAFGRLDVKKRDTSKPAKRKAKRK